MGKIHLGDLLDLGCAPNKSIGFIDILFNFLFVNKNQGRVSTVAGYVFLLLGLVDVPIIHYSVNWWNTLHQGTTVFAKHEAIHSTMWYPLMLMILNFVLIVLVLGSSRFLRFVSK